MRWLALLLLLPLAAQAEDKPRLPGIKGDVDRRQAVTGAEYPWSAMGRFNNSHGAHCSGTLIGPRLAVTAAHCLWNKRTQRQMPASALVFVAGYDRGQYLKAARVAKATLSPRWRFDVPYGPEVAAHDWALVELEEPLGDEVGWVALAGSPEAGRQVTTAGYGQDRAHAPMAHMGCHVTGRLAGGLLLHDCDAVKGDSGGPVLDADLRLVAIHVATLTSEQRVDGGAVGADAFREVALKLGAAREARRRPSP